ncbi:MAG: M6 family metalloprotease domain-containing protein [Bacteroidaceae bacterium]|nr:M6 family metalloprotease domain-containing protein [Bacteroidaceae bacterium]
MKIMRLFLAVCLLITSVTAMAVPAKRVQRTITLADGTQKQVTLVGDENMHFYLDADNIAYTCNAEGMFVRSDRTQLEARWKERLARRNKHRMERAEARGMNLQPGTTRGNSFRRRAQWGAEQNPVSGDKKGLVILVNFSDKSLNSAHGQDFYDRFFNEIAFREQGNVGSVHDYFFECSYGQFNLTFDVYGPVTVSKSYSYYGKNDSDGNDLYPGKMVAEACTLVAQMGADFSKYDWDNDGLVDQVFLVYAGYGEHAGASENTIWPHECTLAEEAQYGDGDGPVTFNGITVDTYAVTSELDGKTGNTPAGIGTACHEFSHCMCLPDFYDTSLGGGRYGMDMWDLMDYGSYSGNNRGNCPTPYTSYERMYCGWLTPQVLNEPCVVSDMKTLYQTPEAYIIYNDNNRNEYYLLENRQGEGFGACDPAKGMLVLHVYFDSSVWTNNGVNSSDIQRMTLVPADGVLSHITNDGDTWPGITGKTELSDTSNPAATLYTENTDGRKLMGKPLEEIEDVDGRISFMFNGGIPMDIPVVLEPAEVKSDGFTARWDAVEGATSYKVMLTAEDLEAQEYSLEEVTLLEEDFSKFNNGLSVDGSSDVGSKMDDYTSMPGWEGSTLFTTPGNEVKMGSNKSAGIIYTPWLTTQTGSVTIVFTARKYKTDSQPLYLIYGEDDEPDIIGEVELYTEPTQYMATITPESSEFWWGLYCEGRCYISEMCAYDGVLTEEQLEASVISRKNTESCIVETEDTSYVFTNLSNKRKYTYSVCALNDTSRSKWSNPVEVQLLSEATAIESLTPTLSGSKGAVYDLSGRKLNSQSSSFNGLKKGVYIKNGKKYLR